MLSTRAPSGKVHAQEKDVAPRAVRQVHAHGGALVDDRVAVPDSVSEQLPCGSVAGGRIRSPMRNIHWLPRTALTLAGANLVGEVLHGELVVALSRARCRSHRRGRRRPWRLSRTRRRLRRSGAPADAGVGLAKVMLAALPSLPTGRRARGWDIEAVDRVEEKQRAHALVEVGRSRAGRRRGRFAFAFEQLLRVESGSHTPSSGVHRGVRRGGRPG